MKTKCCHSSHYHAVDNIQFCLNKSCVQYLGITQCYLDFTKSRYAFALLVFTLSFLISFDDFSKASKTQVEVFPSEINSGSKPISIENVEAELMKQEVACHKAVLAQIRIESGHLSSFLLKRTNNMLGMRYPAKRATAACGIYLPESDTIILGTQPELIKYARMNNYAVYNTWEDAIADYKLWQDANFNVEEKYLDFLGRVYAEDSLYVSKIKYLTKSKK
jgi:hypothetical protein